VYGPDRRRDRELSNCVDHAQPNRHAGKIAIRREFLGPFGAFRHSLVAERVSIRLATRQMSISGITLIG
jgi:hypothetical protein